MTRISIKLTGNDSEGTSDSDVGACHSERLGGVPFHQDFVSYVRDTPQGLCRDT
jgi:hypothetical protein